jgi:hypothetical protein
MFDNRGYSFLRSVRDLALAIGLMVLLVPIVAAFGESGGMVVATGLGAFFLWVRSRRRARLLERMPTTAITQAPGQYAELSGTAESADGRELRDPITQQPCVWFGVETQRLHEQRRMSVWLPIKRAASSREFVLRDRTGVCRVDPCGAEFALSESKVIMVNDRLKHIVWRIEAGAPLYVVGAVEQRDGKARVRRPVFGKYLVTDAPAASKA